VTATGLLDNQGVTALAHCELQIDGDPAATARLGNIRLESGTDSAEMHAIAITAAGTGTGATLLCRSTTGTTDLDDLSLVATRVATLQRVMPTE
jgi:hypothetical protein